MKKNIFLIPLVIYAILTLSTLLYWDKIKINSVTGDEPHYIVMSSGIIKYGTLEQTTPYDEEFRARKIYKSGLAPKGATPSTENTHALLGPNGLFNIHNIGLPLLIAPAYLLAGVFGVKLFMIFLGSPIILFAWKFATYFSNNKVNALWAVLAATISMPFIPASNQVYPDLLAGLIGLMGLHWYLTLNEKRGLVSEILLTIAILLLPWLQIKFSATCIVLIASISVKAYLQSKDLKKVIGILIISGLSFITLASYNLHAFGRVSGPYISGALEISQTSLMVLLGLFIDQNQGFIFQNPVNLIGILAIGWMFKVNRDFILIWGIVFLSLIIPNGLHPAWYGGGSLSGRFQWAAAVTFIIPTLYGLLAIAKDKKNFFRVIILCGLILQLYFFYHYALNGFDLYNKAQSTLFDVYSIFYFPAQSWMPMLYDSSWAFSYYPNYSWTVLVGALLGMGFFYKKSISNKVIICFCIIFSLVIYFTGLISSHPKNEALFYAHKLPSQSGRILNLNRFAEQGYDQPGFITFGPYLPLRKGKYEVVISYRSVAKKTEVVGWADIYNATSGVQVTRTPMQGTNGEKEGLILQFEISQWKLSLFEFRTYWDGISNLEILDITLQQL